MNAAPQTPADDLLLAYAAGSLPHHFAIVMASHVSLNVNSHAALQAHRHVGGLLMEEGARVEVSASAKDALFARLDEPYTPEPVFKQESIYPAPVIEVMKGRSPRWKKLGMGVCQDIIFEDGNGSVRLLYIPPGQAVPDHGHSGLELTLVLQGSFSDETGRFGVGDLEVADADLEHAPIADAGAPCICLAATDAKLKFRAFVPRLLQPFFRI